MVERAREKKKTKINCNWLTVHMLFLISGPVVQILNAIKFTHKWFFNFRIFFRSTWTKMFIFSIRWPKIDCSEHGIRALVFKDAKKRNPFWGVSFGTPLIYLLHRTRVNCSAINIVDVGESGSVVRVCVCSRLFLLWRSFYNICDSIHVRTLYPFVGCFRFERKLSKLLWNFWKSIAPFSLSFCRKKN